jgi:hypothetical protein
VFGLLGGNPPLFRDLLLSFRCLFCRHAPLLRDAALAFGLFRRKATLLCGLAFTFGRRFRRDAAFVCFRLLPGGGLFDGDSLLLRLGTLSFGLTGAFRRRLGFTTKPFVFGGLLGVHSGAFLLRRLLGLTPHTVVLEPLPFGLTRSLGGFLGFALHPLAFGSRFHLEPTPLLLQPCVLRLHPCAFGLDTFALYLSSAFGGCGRFAQQAVALGRFGFAQPALFFFETLARLLDLALGGRLGLALQSFAFGSGFNFEAAALFFGFQSLLFADAFGGCLRFAQQSFALRGRFHLEPPSFFFRSQALLFARAGRCGFRLAHQPFALRCRLHFYPAALLGDRFRFAGGAVSLSRVPCLALGFREPSRLFRFEAEPFALLLHRLGFLLAPQAVSVFCLLPLRGLRFAALPLLFGRFGVALLTLLFTRLFCALPFLLALPFAFRLLLATMPLLLLRGVVVGGRLLVAARVPGKGVAGIMSMAVAVGVNRVGGRYLRGARHERMRARRRFHLGFFRAQYVAADFLRVDRRIARREDFLLLRLAPEAAEESRAVRGFFPAERRHHRNVVRLDVVGSLDEPEMLEKIFLIAGREQRRQENDVGDARRNRRDGGVAGIHDLKFSVYLVANEAAEQRRLPMVRFEGQYERQAYVLTMKRKRIPPTVANSTIGAFSML